MSRLVIRQFKSAIGEKHAAKETLASIGLRRPGNVVVREDSPTLRGQLRKIAHLVEIRADLRSGDVAVENERRAAPPPKRAAAAPAPATARRRHGKPAPAASGSES